MCEPLLRPFHPCTSRFSSRSLPPLPATALIQKHSYIASRIYLHNPPGEGNALMMHDHLPESEKERRAEKEAKNPRITLSVAVIGIVLTIGLMACSAEWVS